MTLTSGGRLSQGARQGSRSNIQYPSAVLGGGAYALVVASCPIATTAERSSPGQNANKATMVSCPSGVLRPSANLPWRQRQRTVMMSASSAKRGQLFVLAYSRWSATKPNMTDPLTLTSTKNGAPT